MESSNADASAPVTGNEDNVTYEEKRLLSLNINRLTGPHLAQIVRIVEECEPSARNVENEVELDFENLQPSTLRQLEAYVVSVLGEHYFTCSGSEEEDSLEEELNAEEGVQNVGGKLAGVDLKDNHAPKD